MNFGTLKPHNAHAELGVDADRPSCSCDFTLTLAGLNDGGEIRLRLAPEQALALSEMLRQAARYARAPREKA